MTSVVTICRLFYRYASVVPVCLLLYRYAFSLETFFAPMNICRLVSEICSKTVRWYESLLGSYTLYTKGFVVTFRQLVWIL